MRDLYWKTYWSVRLLGYRVDPATVIIRSMRRPNRRWHFCVFDGTFVLKNTQYDPHRLQLTTKHGRVDRVEIG